MDMTDMAGYTQEFQEIWSELILGDQNLNEKFDEIDKLIEKGADINSPFFNDLEGTALSQIIYELHYCSDLKKEYFLEMVYYILSKDSMSADSDCVFWCLSSKNYKLLEDILKKFDGQIPFQQYQSPDSLEIMLGYSCLDIYTKVNYHLTYKKDDGIWGKTFLILPIDVLFMNLILYFTGRGNSVQSEEQIKYSIFLLKRYGSPEPSFSNIYKIIQDDELFNDFNDKKKEIAYKKFQQAMKFYNTL
jgi:hypothetical protein